jgi:hypothetical protein
LLAVWRRSVDRDRGVSKRNPYAKHAVGVELEVILDVIVVSLWADEEVGQVVPKAIANADPKVLHEVVAARVVDAPGSVAGAQEAETVAGNADAAHEVEAEFFGYPGLEERVDVSKNGAVVLVTIVAGLVISPGGFRADAETGFPEADIVKADVGIDATGFRRRMKIHGVANWGEGLEERGAGGDIHLLGRDEAGKQKNHTRGYEQREFSQYSPLASPYGFVECTRQIGDTTAKPPRTAARSTIRALGVGCSGYQIRDASRS